jgi:hypothetical protein
VHRTLKSQDVVVRDSVELIEQFEDED